MTAHLICVVEGRVDAEVARVLAQQTGYSSVIVPIMKHGRGNIAAKVRDYHRAAKHQPFFVLADLDADLCPSALLADWRVPSFAPRFICRIAVREIEAWLLADRAAFAKFMRISPDSVPSAPESVSDPKRLIVDLAARSTSRELQEAMRPRPGAHRREGPQYSSRLSEFIRSAWEPRRARTRAPSLHACLVRLEQMRGTFSPLVITPRRANAAEKVYA